MVSPAHCPTPLPLLPGFFHSPVFNPTLLSPAAMSSLPLCVCVCVCVFILSHFSHVRFYMTLWTIAHQTIVDGILPMGFSRQEHWSRLPCPPSGDLPHAGIEPTSPASPALKADSFTVPPRKPPHCQSHHENGDALRSKLQADGAVISLCPRHCLPRPPHVV